MAARPGLVALGDSITVGEGNMVCGIPCRSWALWLAQALDLPFESRAANGALTREVRELQLPAVRGDHALGTIYTGVNDVRGVDWDAVAYEQDLQAIAAGLAPLCERLLLVTLPVDLGRPPALDKPREANAAIRRVAREAGAVLCELDDLAGWTHVLPDVVHPTALGQLEIADRAAAALGSPHRPSDAVGGIRLGPRGRVSYGRTHLRLLARDVVRRRVEAVRA